MLSNLPVICQCGQTAVFGDKVVHVVKAKRINVISINQWHQKYAFRLDLANGAHREVGNLGVWLIKAVRNFSKCFILKLF